MEKLKNIFKRKPKPPTHTVPPTNPLPPVTPNKPFEDTPIGKNLQDIYLKELVLNIQKSKLIYMQN